MKMSSDVWRQFVAISPVYFLQLCYGMSSGYPAITTPQLTMDCALFSINDDQESWIGNLYFFFLNLQILNCSFY